jgi:hypothetical protein
MCLPWHSGGGGKIVDGEAMVGAQMLVMTVAAPTVRVRVRVRVLCRRRCGSGERRGVGWQIGRRKRFYSQRRGFEVCCCRGLAEIVSLPSQRPMLVKQHNHAICN